ncbi:Transmembrane protein [Armadillidium vulgare]|nr:Transmembrane protein [Armadillidium vulgare]
MIDPVSKKEPSKTSKKQIKEYASKYKNYQDDGLKKTPWYRDPWSTQPAHLITCIAFVYLAFRLFPDSRRGSTGASTLTRLLYVSSISTVFGAQFWMTFVSGLALFFSIPRHMFAKVQAVLFPLYFLINATLLLIAIVTYTQHNPTHL